ncbi:MAG TPA: TonB-dependent receptor [Candidatus Cloacimonetes bacterium]|nr:TonB-dependent receptor [Candidatus Cloacimonadota bacterium]
MKKNHLFCIFILLFFILNSLFAEEFGNIAGKVTSKKTGNPIVNAQIFIEDKTSGTYSKENGSFYLKNVPVGEHTVYTNFIGYKPESKIIIVEENTTAIVNFSLVSKAVEIAGFDVTANRAKKRETPIAFTNIDQEQISDKYTTEDMPQLLDDVPGLFANTTGIGDAQITMRGFEADKIQVLINGIPVNDPESQKVYWSNWTGLSSNVKSVQVQKGAGSSLYGSGAFGGSLNIETIGNKPERSFTLRSSYGRYLTSKMDIIDHAITPANSEIPYLTRRSLVADGKGHLIDYHPSNYNLLFRYNSGNIFNRKFIYNLMIERKAGDYYLSGTNYDGYSFGLETQTLIGQHKMNLSFIGAPQNHNQVYFKSDRDLFAKLGREYNRNNHSYQENYYFKPQISLRDEWKISENQILMTNFFVTKGDGGGKYLNQDKFDIETGTIYFHDGFLDDDDPGAFEHVEFAKHALYLYENYNLIVEGFNPQDTIWIGPIPVEGPSYNGELISGEGKDFFNSRYDYSWRNNSISDHFQFGGNTYYQHDLNSSLNLVVGGEFRKWNADHIGKRENFRHFNPEFPDSVETYEKMQRTYDYSSTVSNMSAFARTQIKPFSKMNIMIDGQYASYTSKVEENPIEIYDLGNGQPTGYYFYSTKEKTETDTSGVETFKFSKDDYQKTFNFFSPKFGINYNLTHYLNLIANYSIAYKEPKTRDWYSGYDGPDGNQMYEIDLVDSLNQEYSIETFYGELKPEKINTMEFGIGYEGAFFDLNANYYLSDYVDKIERVDVPVTNFYYDADNDSVYTVQRDESLTLNAGQARHQGLELSSNIKYENIDASFSLTYSKNRWVEMNVEQIFKGDADEMIGKVVPFSPEKMANADLGYTFQNLPFEGKLRMGLTAKYWDDYYANYTNEYYSNYIDDGSGGFEADSTSITSSKLPYFFELGANLKYSFYLGEKEFFIRLNLNNITNRDDNFSSANVKKDYNRGYFDEDGKFVDDYLTGNDYMYVTPSPLFNLFLTMEVKF